MAWYDRFRTSGDHRTIKSVHIKLPDDFIGYLKEDGILLPPVPQSLQPGLSVHDPRFREDKEEEKADKKFEDLQVQIQDAILALGGAVFVKTNWSAPVDAKWMLGSLKCQSVGQIIMLLKSSSLVMHDLMSAYDNCFDKGDIKPRLYLTLKRWCNLEKSREFRLVVLDNQLKAIVQREAREYYQYLSLEDQRAEVQHALVLFWQCYHLKVAQSCYTIDTYIDKTGKVWIIDINPLASVQIKNSAKDDELSHSLHEVCFPHLNLQWDDLLELRDETITPVFKYVSSQAEADSAVDLYASSRVPIELISGDLDTTIASVLNERVEVL